jgi:hypothetical protein
MQKQLFYWMLYGINPGKEKRRKTPEYGQRKKDFIKSIHNLHRIGGNGSGKTNYKTF